MAATNGSPVQKDGISPKIIFYTNHGCPWAHRSAIVLKELDLPYEEVIIPLDRPRDPSYLKINPRGLVPSIKISNGILKDEIITESATVSTFLADLFPKPGFYPASHESPTSALTRARMAFFVDTWFTKVHTLFFPILKAEGQEKSDMAYKLVEALKKEIEPLLENAGPFFGGGQSMTLADALTAPFALRYKVFCEEGLIPSDLSKELETLPNYSKWSKAICAQESVTHSFDGPKVAKQVSEKLAQMKAVGK